MTAESTVNAYLRTRVLTASPEQLRLMLLEGAIRFLQQGRDGLARRDFESSFDGMSKARNIVMELINSMRPEVAPDLCAKIQSLYVFIYQTIVEASFEKDVAKADKALELLNFECETWRLTMAKLAEERSGDAVASNPSALPAQPTAPFPQPRPALGERRQTLSISG